MGEEIFYFDNAATTFPKPEEVYNAADAFYRNSGGNSGRGNNVMSLRAGGIAKEAKENLRLLFSCPAREVVFTSSATDALNRILLGVHLEPSDSVYITPFEHNAVTRPLHHRCESDGVNLFELAFSKKMLTPDFGQIEHQFNEERPKLVVMTHASNVCGAVVPVLDIARIAKKYGATVVIDMSQTAGLVPLDLSTQLVDFAVFAGHKTLYAPFGIGGFLCWENAELSPVLFGGNGVNSIQQDMPKNIVQMCEVGSQNTYAIAGLQASTSWLLDKGVSQVFAEEEKKRERLLEVFRDFPMLTIVGNAAESNQIGVVSVLFDRFSPDEAEMLLSKMKIAVRAGLHCAPFAHRFLETLPAGTVRFSVSALSQEQDFQALHLALKYIDENS